MEWVEVENRRDGELNHYYVVNENDLLIFKNGEKVFCKLQNSSEKQLILSSKRYQVVRHENGIPYYTYTDRWYVVDDKDEYLVEIVKISRDDIEQYK